MFDVYRNEVKIKLTSKNSSSGRIVLLYQKGIIPVLSKNMCSLLIFVLQSLIQDIAIEIDALLELASLDLATTRCQVQ